MDCGNIEATDGKLKFQINTIAGKYLGWNGILVEKSHKTERL